MTTQRFRVSSTSANASTRKLRRLPALAAAAIALAAAGLSTGAQAQMRMPGETYIGLQLGNGRANVPCADGYSCDRDDPAVRLSVGRLYSPYWGLEAGFLDNGHVHRSGGDTRVRSADLSLVGRVPMDRWALYGKLGVAYSRTATSADPLSGTPTGGAAGWGPMVALGVSYDLNANWSVLAEAQRSRIEFAGSGNRDVDSTTVGVNFRF